MAVQSFLKLTDMELEGKRVFLRLDLNVPLKDGKILDQTRIDAALPTLKYLVNQGAKVIVASHLGRPKTKEDHAKYSLEPVANALNEKGYEVLLMDTPDSDAPLELTKSLKDNQIIMLENLRFAPGETKNSGELAQKWSRYTDVYINDAFGASHRAHASIDALPRIIKQKTFGFLIEKEVESLEKILNDPPQPFVVILGGGKVSDKISVLENFADKADKILVGGAMSYTFMKSQGIAVGNSKLENEKLNVAKKFIHRMEGRGKEFCLPEDHVVVDEFGSTDGTTTEGRTIPQGKIAVDIGPKTEAKYGDIIKNAGSVFWNGPMGMYETKPFDKGSVAIAKAMAETSAFTVVGGGDSAAVSADSGYSNKISHISTGGGASIEFIQGIPLPGLEALKVRVVE